MSRKNKLIGTLVVLGALLWNYMTQISHVPSEQIAKWGLHDWVGASIFVIYAGLREWKQFLLTPEQKKPDDKSTP